MTAFVTDYGAVPGTGELQTNAIQRAIDDCAAHGGGTVNVPAGVFVTGTIYLKSNVELHLEAGAELKASMRAEDFNALDAYPENYGIPREGWDGRHLVIAHDCDNVALTGMGRINGGADAIFTGRLRYFDFTDRWSYGVRYQEGMNYREPERSVLRPGQTVVFVNCRNVRVVDITIVNTPAWALFLHGCRDVQIRGYKVWNDRTWVNTDGLDIDTCQNVTVSDCLIDTGDDAIAIRCDSLKLKNGMTACENIIVSNCVLASSACAFRFGVGVGEIRHVLISDVVIPRTGVVFAFMTSYMKQGHAVIEDVGIRHVTAHHTSKPFTLCESNDCRIAHVTFSDYRAVCYAGGFIRSETRGNICDITVRNMDLNIVATPFERPILDDGNNHLFEIENADDVRFEGFRSSYDDGLSERFGEEFLIRNSSVTA